VGKNKKKRKKREKSEKAPELPLANYLLREKAIRQGRRAA
jgi:hypothetical protein